MSFQINQIIILDGAGYPRKESSTQTGTSYAKEMGLSEKRKNNVLRGLKENQMWQLKKQR